MKPTATLTLLSIVLLGTACASKYAVNPSYYSSESQRQVLVVQKTRPPAEKIALGAFAAGTAFGLYQLASHSSLAAELEEAAYPVQSPEDVRQKGRDKLGSSVGYGLVGGGLLYLALRGGFPTQRSIYSCTASSVGFDRKKRLSEEDFQAFLEEGKCKHVHTHDDYFLGLGFLPRNLPNY